MNGPIYFPNATYPGEGVTFDEFGFTIPAWMFQEPNMKTFANEEYNDRIIISIREDTLDLLELMFENLIIKEWDWGEGEYDAMVEFFEQTKQYRTLRNKVHS